MNQSAGVPVGVKGKPSLRFGVGRVRRRGDIDQEARKAIESLFQISSINATIASCKAYALGTPTSIIHVVTEEHGHLLAVSSNKRFPTWAEIAEARYKLIPEDVDMAFTVPCSDRLVSFHPNCFLLWEAQPVTKKKQVITPYS